MSSKIIGAIELGTHKTTVLMGEVSHGRSLNILGLGKVYSQGVKKGEVLDYRTASEMVHQAIVLAEQSAGAELERVYLAQTGGHLKGFRSMGSVSVSASDNRVSATDIKRVTENAKSKELSKDRVYIHHIQNAFLLDARECSNPMNMQGDKLEVAYWSIHGDVRKVRDPIHIINGFGLQVEDIILSSIASGAIVANETEKQNGVLVVDIGCGTTDYALYKDGYIVYTGVIPVGGDHLTNDLSLGLRITHDHAERIKLDAGKAFIDDTDKESPVTLTHIKDMNTRTVQRHAIYQILNARVTELFQLIRTQLETQWDFSHPLPGGVILTGGTSLLPGIESCACTAFEQEIRVNPIPNWVNDSLREPGMATALGLLQYALGGSTQETVSQLEASGGLLKRVSQIFSGS
tara:strand:+ start:63487 stop:64701 length:1215 start_codon:yes stop_codon:yes gene_type:complete